MKIYLAGKIGINDWRTGIIPGLRNAVGMCDEEYDNFVWYHQWPVMEKCIFGIHDYVGPYFVSCDHGCFHGEGTHGTGALSKEALEGHYPLGCSNCDAEYDKHTGGVVSGPIIHRRRATFHACNRAIQQSDLVFAWLTDFDCFGTIAELGFAHAYGKSIVLGYPPSFRPYLDEFWFVRQMADHETCTEAPASALRFLLSRPMPETIHKGHGLSRSHSILWKSAHRIRSKIRDVRNYSTTVADKGSAAWRELLDVAVANPLLDIMYDIDGATHSAEEELMR